MCGKPSLFPTSQCPSASYLPSKGTSASGSLYKTGNTIAKPMSKLPIDHGQGPGFNPIPYMGPDLQGQMSGMTEWPSMVLSEPAHEEAA